MEHPQGNRRRLEDLLNQSLKRINAKDKSVPLVYTAYREGFKTAMAILGVIESSSKELNAKQFELLIEYLEEYLELTPPPPESSYSIPL